MLVRHRGTTLPPLNPLETKPAPAIVLASRSPRRRELLALFDLPFEVLDADVDEAPRAGESAEAMTERLAVAKATAVSCRCPGRWVLGGDTTVFVDGDLLGKPADRSEAIHMLERLSGRSHEVVSAVSLIGPDFKGVDISLTSVDFMDLSPGMIAAYCDTGEPFDKAGGYGIQGQAGTFVKAIRGSYSGIVGLPLFETRMLLHRAGLI